MVTKTSNAEQNPSLNHPSSVTPPQPFLFAPISSAARLPSAHIHRARVRQLNALLQTVDELLAGRNAGGPGGEEDVPIHAEGRDRPSDKDETEEPEESPAAARATATGHCCAAAAPVGVTGAVFPSARMK